MKNAFLKPNLVDAEFFRLRNMCSAYIDRIDKTYSTDLMVPAHCALLLDAPLIRTLIIAKALRSV